MVMAIIVTMLVVLQTRMRMMTKITAMSYGNSNDTGDTWIMHWTMMMILL